MPLHDIEKFRHVIRLYNDEVLAAQKAELKAKFIGLMQKKFVMSGEVLYAYEELKKQIEML